MKYLKIAQRFSVSNVLGVNKLSIRNRLITIASGLLVALIATNLYLKAEISSANNTMREQGRVSEQPPNSSETRSFSNAYCQAADPKSIHEGANCWSRCSFPDILVKSLLPWERDRLRDPGSVASKMLSP